MLEQKPRPTASPSSPRTTFDSKQPRRLRLALLLLLITLAGVLIRDRQFWFGTEDLSDGDVDVAQPEVARQTVAASRSASPAPSAVASTAKKKIAAALRPAEPAEPAAAKSGAIATTRMVLPPLDVEVVAGDAHSTIHPGSNIAKVDITNSRPAVESVEFSGAPTKAAERETMSTASVQAPYPMLAQQMRVQGSVILQAIIGVNGEVQNLQVLRGPAILASAAQQAVRQWRFKPYLQNGQPVETKARITVNFTINVAGNSPKTS